MSPGMTALASIVLCLILDSRQNEHPEWEEQDKIVLCLILDSRQNLFSYLVNNFLIVLCLILDSRQNAHVRVSPSFKLYCALFWIQGKTDRYDGAIDYDCTVPYFGFKAKQAPDAAG